MRPMILKNISLAVATLRASRGRSFLTMLGVVIAVAGVTSVVSIGHGIKDAVASQANQYSENVITVRPSHIGSSGGALSALSTGVAATALNDKDVAAITKQSDVSAVVPLSIVGSSAKADSRFDGIIFAASSDLPAVLNQELEYGAFFTETETSNSVAVLGSNAADKLFDQKVPLGRTLDIRGRQYIVSGVLSPFTSTPFSTGANFNDAIFLPSSAADTLAPNGAPIYEILAKVNDKDNVASTDKSIGEALSKDRRSSGDVSVLSPDELAKENSDTFDLLTYMVVAAAIITMIVSGIGIMNVMLVSVTERMHEIGIRKAVGATNRQILNQFMTEAATLSAVGSFMGVLLSILVVYFLKVFTSLDPVFDWRAALLASVAACIFGIIFGSLPAIKAARKDPIAALRSE